VEEGWAWVWSQWNQMKEGRYGKWDEPYGEREGGEAEKKGYGVEVPGLELVVKGASENDADEVRGEEDGWYLCIRAQNRSATSVIV
jgi:hypothetical protein